MLGDKLGEERGQLTGLRVLPAQGGAPRVEVSFQAKGKILGQDTNDMGTYTSMAQPDGSMIGEGQGIIMTADGEVATWIGTGVGHFTGKGTAAKWRGSVYYRAAGPKLARLNGVACVFEHDVDENGAAHNQFWEWK